MPLSNKHQTAAIDLLIRAGFPNEVIAAFTRYKEKLSEDLDMAPPKELQKRVQSLKEQSSQTEHPEISVTGSDRKVEEKLSKSQPASSGKYVGDVFRQSQWNSQKPIKTWLTISITAVIVITLSSWFFLGRSGRSNTNVADTPPNSIAVLPFTYINAPDSTDYFSLGMTEEILTKLARAGGLSVTSRTSVMQYQNSSLSLKEIAGELGVAAVVEGSINRSGDQIRISAKLIDADTDLNLWANSYDRSLENILAVQNEVASHIANALQIELLPQEVSDDQQLPEVNEEAYHKYLLGKHLLDINEPGGVVQAVDYFKESVALDSTFAPAYSNLAMATLLSGLVSRFSEEVTGVRGIPLKEAVQSASYAARRALNLDSTMLEAHLTTAIIYELIDQDWERSEQRYQQALQLNPNHSETLRYYGWHLLRVGELDKALKTFEKAVMLDPLSWATHHSLGYANYCNRSYDQAIQQLETSISLGSLYPNTKKYLSTARFKKSRQLFEEGKTNEAKQMIEEASTMLDEMWGAHTGWKETVIAAAMGEKGFTQKSLENQSLPLPPRIYATLLIGDQEAALALIESRLNFRHRVFLDPIFDSVRSNERFQQLVREKLNREISFP